MKTAQHEPQTNILDRIPTSGQKTVLDRIEASDELGAKFMEVTPSMAERWLRQNEHNRHMRSGRVERYGNMMDIDEWLPVADAIAFDVNGSLQNGQHRLKALKESGNSEIFLVAWNLPTESFKHTDVGLKRTPSDALEVEGYKDPIPVAAAARLLVLWRRGELDRCGSYKAVENYEVLGVVQRCGGNESRLHEDVKYVRGGKSELEKHGIPRAMMTFVKFVYEPTYQEKARQFVNQIMTGEKIPSYEGDLTAPSKLIRDKFSDVKDEDGKKMERETKMAYIIKAANWHCKDDIHTRLRYRDSDSFPEIKADLPPEFE